MLGASLCAYAQEGKKGGPPQPTTTRSETPDNPQSLAHIEAAKKNAGDDPVLQKAYNFFCTVNDINAPQPEQEAVKVFDNLYILTSSPFQQTTVYAITTSDGIIMIDSGEAGRLEKILAGFSKVGLDPSKVKYILLGHGHGDHYAAALYFQEHFGTKVGASAADWDLMWPANAPAAAGDDKNPKPKRDLVLKEGTPLKLGDETVNVVEIPGHTPGSLAFIFKVQDGKATHTAGLFGGTIQDQPRITVGGLNQYIGSIDHYLETAKKMKVDVEIQNHAMFDDTPVRLARVQARKAGEPNPFVMPIDKYSRMWNVVSECIGAAIARRPDGN